MICSQRHRTAGATYYVPGKNRHPNPPTSDGLQALILQWLEQSTRYHLQACFRRCATHSQLNDCRRCCFTNACISLSVCFQDGDYGKHRLWASIGWGGLSTLSGYLISRYGIRLAFIIYGVLSVPCLFMATAFKKGAQNEGQEVRLQHS